MYTYVIYVICVYLFICTYSTYMYTYVAMCIIYQLATVHSYIHVQNTALQRKANFTAISDVYYVATVSLISQ